MANNTRTPEEIKELLKEYEKAPHPKMYGIATPASGESALGTVSVQQSPNNPDKVVFTTDEYIGDLPLEISIPAPDKDSDKKTVPEKD